MSDSTLEPSRVFVMQLLDRLKLSRKQFEILAVLIVYCVTYVYVIGPVLGSAFGFEEDVLGEGFVLQLSRSDAIWDVFTTPRGWIFLGLGLFVLFGYMGIRARMSGSTLKNYWNE